MAYGTIDPEKCERMLARIDHRGPGRDGACSSWSHAWLGHQRLSIMDVGGGKQPIADDTGSAYVVGNGEIYNHEDIRDVSRGPVCHRSDPSRGSGWCCVTARRRCRSREACSRCDGCALTGAPRWPGT